MDEDMLKQQRERVPVSFEAFKHKDLSFPTELLKKKARPLGNTSVGNFSTVNLAEFQGRTVFVKSLKTEEGKEHYAFVELAILRNLRFLNHKQSLGSASPGSETKHNSHILEFIGAFLQAGKVQLVCEYLERGDLKIALQNDLQYFKQDVNAADLHFVWKQRVRAVKHIATAVCRLHELNIVHRDIKSENIFLTGRGKRTVFKLGDFGMARGIHSLDLEEQRAYTICGTDELMAPEMLLCLPYDHSVDMYSLGLVMAELICGRGPSCISSGSQLPSTTPTDFRGDFLKRSASDAFDIDLKELDRYAVAGCPLDLIEFTKQALSYESRYRLSAEELVDSMNELEADLNAKRAERVPSKVPARKPNRRMSRNSQQKSQAISHSPTQDSFLPTIDEKALQKKMMSVDGKYDITNKHPRNIGLGKLTRGLRRKKHGKTGSRRSKGNVESEMSTPSMTSTTRSVGKRVRALQARLAEKQQRSSQQFEL